jgi:isopropylmalate/homocitrate/citramalate synthase
MCTAVFGFEMIELQGLSLSPQEKEFLQAINTQLSEKVPIIPISKMNLNHRQLWRAALVANFKGLQVLKALRNL